MTPVSIRSDNYRGKAEYIAAILILVPLVFHRIFLGGSGGSYEDYPGFELSFVGYFANIISLILPAIYMPNIKNNKYFYILYILFIVSVFQLFNSMYLFDIDRTGILLANLRSILWIAAISVYCAYYFDKVIFTKAFIDLMTIAAIFAIFTYVVYFLFGVPLCVNIDRGVGRIQGLFSEPSTLSAVYPGFILACMFEKKYNQAFLGVLVVALSFSIICYTTSGVAMLLFLLHKYRKMSKIFVYTAVTTLVLITLLSGSGIEQGAHLLAQYLKSFVDIFWSDGPIRANTIDRVIDALASMSNFVTTSQKIEVESSGSLARFVGAVSMLENMSLDGTLWFGYGLSNYGYITDELYNTVLDFGFLPYLISSFGIFFGVFIAFYSIINIVKYLDIYLPIYFIFVCSFFGTIYNSGGGITAYTLPVLGFLSALSLKAVKQRRYQNASVSV